MIKDREVAMVNAASKALEIMNINSNVDSEEIIKQVITRDFDLNTAINDMCSIPATSVFYKRNILDKVDPKIMMLDNTETEFWIEIAKFFKIYRIESTLSNFRLFNNKNRLQNDMYSFAKTTYDIGRRHGASIWSPCAKRYYLALATRPIQKIIDPIFHYMSTGDAERSNFLVKATRPFHPVMAAVYHFVVGSKKQAEPKK